jgi:hypothetical protein
MFLADGTEAYSTLWRHGERVESPESPRTVAVQVESDRPAVKVPITKNTGSGSAELLFSLRGTTPASLAK